MKRLASKVIRYAVISILFCGVVFGIFSTLVSAYDIIQATRSWLPTLPLESFVGVVSDPVSIVVVSGLSVGVAGVLYRYYGSVGAVVVGGVKWVDSLGGWSLFDDPTVVGRLAHDGVSWRFKYWDGGHVEFERRECLFYGLRLVERVLRREVVHGPNTGAKRSETNREVAEDAWSNVFGREKGEDHSEVLAMACPDCNFSVTGSKETVEGKDAAEAKFRKHIERMRAAGSRRKPFATYRNTARDTVGGEPLPSDIWDAYVRLEAPDDALPVSPTVGNTAGGSTTADAAVGSGSEGSNHV